MTFAEIAPRHDLLSEKTEPADALLESLVPGTAYVRYGRMWRMARWRRRERYVSGRIGFTRSTGVTELWNEELEDFEEVAQIEGVTSPFAIDLRHLRVAFQLRPGIIRPRTFTGAMQALLNEATYGEALPWHWRVDPYVREISWPSWVATVQRVKKLSVRLERPNPDYADRDAVEAIIEGARANILQMVLTADPSEMGGLDIDDEFVREAIEHAEDYGEWSAVGETVEAGLRRDVQWRSEHEGVAPQTAVEPDPVTGEVNEDDLVRELDDFQPPNES